MVSSLSTALWCVLAVGIMPVLSVGLAKWGTKLDNNHPRDWAQSLTGYRRRAYAAHQNGYEAFPLFAISVVIAELNDGPRGMIDALALSVLAARLAYVACYLSDKATMRSITWALGWFASIGIFLTPLWR
jgi:uncharacterized MAPEG superfamily protein